MCGLYIESCLVAPHATIPDLDVRERSLGQNSLCNHATERHHSQSAVGNFLFFHLVDLGFRLSGEETNRVKSKITSCTSGSLQSLHKSNGSEDFGKTDPQEQLAHGTLFDKGVVGSDRGESLVRLRKRVDSESHVHGSKTKNGELAYTSVLKFGFSKEVHRDEVGETEWIESGITNISSKIRRVFKERKGSAGNVGGRGFYFFSRLL